jgi:topoisomerase-4 subunit B
MAENKKHIYDESKIKTLSSLEHIRLRTGMYIGRIGDGSHYDDGCYILLKEVIDNAIDEFIMGYGKEVQLNIEGHTVSVRDFGRGIPLGKVVDCVSKINTGAKYNDDVFQFSVGLNGVGTKAVNALVQGIPGAQPSRRRIRGGLVQAGKLKGEKDGKARRTGRHPHRFVPDPEIFKDFAVQPEMWSGGCGITATSTAA